MTRVKRFFAGFFEIIRILWSSSRGMTILLVFNNLSRNAVWPFRALVVKQIVSIITLSAQYGFEAYQGAFTAYMLLFFFFFLLNRIWWPLNSYTQTLMLAKVNNNMQNRIIEVMKRAELPFFDLAENYDVYTQALAQTDGRQPINAVNNILNLFSGIVSFVTAFSLMLSIDVAVAFILILSSVPSLIWENSFNKRLYNLEQETVREKRVLNYIFELFTDKVSAKEIRINQTGDYLLNKHDGTFREYNKKYLSLAASKLKNDSMFWLILQIALMASYYIIISRAAGAAIDLGSVSFFLSMAVSLQGDIRNIGNNINKAVSSNRYMNNLVKLEEMNVEREQGPGEEVPLQIHEIEFRNVSFSYPGSDEPALKNVSFTLSSGSRSVLVGENGSGKTTLIKLLLGFYRPTEGEILLNGTPIDEYDPEDYRRLFTVCFQDYGKYGFTLRENIVMANEELSDGALSDIIDRVDLRETVDGLKSKQDTYLSREYDLEGVELSGGQYNRIAIARALAKDAQIVLFDEPSASLDAKAERGVFNIYDDMCQDKLGIMITHRLSTAVRANMIMVLKGGRLIECGTHDTLLAAGGEYAGMFNMQAKQYIKEL